MDHGGALKPALWLVVTAAFAQDPASTLQAARDHILAETARLTKTSCVETIDRTYYSRTNVPDPLPSCEQIVIDRVKGSRLRLDGTDRVRVAVTFSPDREIYSWTGSSPFPYSVEDILYPGPIGTGALAGYVLDLFRNPSVRFHPMAERPQTLEYGFRVPIEDSHYSVRAGDRWLATGYSGMLRMDRESKDLRLLTFETDELPRATSMCESSSTLEFEGSEPLTRKSVLRNVMRDASETESAATIADCREYRVNAAPERHSEGAPLPPDIRLKLVFDAAIDTDVAAAGDEISATIVEAASMRTDAIRFNDVRGAKVRGRILRMEHRTARQATPATFQISLAFDRLERNGVVSPFHATMMSGPATKDGSGILVFVSKSLHYVVEAPFYTNWRTTPPKAAR